MAEFTAAAMFNGTRVSVWYDSSPSYLQTVLALVSSALSINNQAFVTALAQSLLLIMRANVTHGLTMSGIETSRRACPECTNRGFRRWACWCGLS
jgi:hypothetical protein